MARLRVPNHGIVNHPSGASSVYAPWCEEITANMIAHHLDPGFLTESDVDSISLFAYDLTPVKQRIELIKREHQADNLLELNRHLRILVLDSGKKLQTTMEGQKTKKRRKTDHDGHRDITEPPSKC